MSQPIREARADGMWLWGRFITFRTLHRNAFRNMVLDYDKLPARERAHHRQFTFDSEPFAGKPEPDTPLPTRPRNRWSLDRSPTHRAMCAFRG